MELSKHKNHINPAYLSWLRQQSCVISGEKAECAHHIRLGTNGGSSLKPSDYFCIPLLNEFHATGLFAIHIIGEETFLRKFNLNKNQLFINYLTKYILDKYDTYVDLGETSETELIAYLINFVEEHLPPKNISRKKMKSKKNNPPIIVKESITKNEFYQKAKELKRVKDKKLRKRLKPATKKSTPTATQSEFYEKVKEQKRIQDKELRAKLKLAQNTKNTKKTKKSSASQSEYYQKAKELKRIRDKELRQKLKEQRKNP